MKCGVGDYTKFLANALGERGDVSVAVLSDEKARLNPPSATPRPWSRRRSQGVRQEIPDRRILALADLISDLNFSTEVIPGFPRSGEFSRNDFA